MPSWPFLLLPESLVPSSCKKEHSTKAGSWRRQARRARGMKLSMLHGGASRREMLRLGYRLRIEGRG